MAKIVKGDWEFVVERIGGEMQYSAHYGMTCEYGDLQPKGVPVLSYAVENEKSLPQFTEQEEAQIFNFIMNVVRPKLEAYERY